jgi:ureidoglycolate lyase
LDALSHPAEIAAEPLQREAYGPYGDVVAADRQLASTSANAGTATRYDRLAAFENRRPGSALPNLCVFRVQPFAGKPFIIRVLERHRHSTQVFIPMAGAERYLVIVCEGRETPDLRTLKAFVARTGQGVTYRPGIWHHPLIALDQPTDFACLVYEDGTLDDGEVRDIAPAVNVRY